MEVKVQSSNPRGRKMKRRIIRRMMNLIRSLEVKKLRLSSTVKCFTKLLKNPSFRLVCSESF
jgi:hypothetical protein